ncbi:hypothetical protein CCP1ISM_2370001 [Azospirillaceae bacterium]
MIWGLANPMGWVFGRSGAGRTRAGTKAGTVHRASARTGNVRRKTSASPSPGLVQRLLARLGLGGKGPLPQARRRRAAGAAAVQRLSLSQQLGRYRRELAFGLAAVVVVAGSVLLVVMDGGERGRGTGGTLAVTGTVSSTTVRPRPGEDGDKTVLGCVRGATASALSAAIPVAPLVTTGMLVPGSAALIATASALGCGVGAVSTTATSVAAWAMRQVRSVSLTWGG